MLHHPGEKRFHKCFARGCQCTSQPGNAPHDPCLQKQKCICPLTSSQQQEEAIVPCSYGYQPVVGPLLFSKIFRMKNVCKVNGASVWKWACRIRMRFLSCGQTANKLLVNRRFCSNIRSVKNFHLSNESPFIYHLPVGTKRGGGAGSGMTRCQQLFAKEKSLTPTFRSIEKPLVVTREARTSKIVLNPIEEQNPGSFSIPHFNCGMQSADQRSDAF